jgi:hypothetical protein
MKLTAQEIAVVMKRLPFFQVSYETVLHKKQTLRAANPVYIGWPEGELCYLWLTFYLEHDICLLIDSAGGARQIAGAVRPVWAQGTLMRGVVGGGAAAGVFFVDDLYWYKGTSLWQQPWGVKLGYLRLFFAEQAAGLQLQCRLPNHAPAAQPRASYSVHKCQLRSLTDGRAPFYNIAAPAAQPGASATPLRAVFAVSAAPQYDIYYLHAYKNAQQPREKVDVACIMTMKTSVFMNHLFRRIRENVDLSLVEDTEDEADFENQDENKYTDLNKMILMECEYNPKYKKWTPCKVVSARSRIVNYYAVRGGPTKDILSL